MRLSANQAFMGIRLWAVNSRSMEPAIRVGSLLVTKQKEPSQILPGDIITVQQLGQEAVTHRVTAKRLSEEEKTTLFVTKGDANETVDAEEVLPEAIKGKLIVSVPYLGRLLRLLQVPSGRVAFVTTLVALMVGHYFWLLLLERKQTEARKTEGRKKDEKKKQNV